MKMKLQYRRKLFSKTAFENADVYNQFLNRATENTNIVQGKTFLSTNSDDLPYLTQWKSNPSLSPLVKSFKYDKWKAIRISRSPILFKLLYIKQIQNYEMIVQLGIYSRFQKC